MMHSPYGGFPRDMYAIFSSGACTRPIRTWYDYLSPSAGFNHGWDLKCTHCALSASVVALPFLLFSRVFSFIFVLPIFSLFSPILPFFVVIFFLFFHLRFPIFLCFSCSPVFPYFFLLFPSFLFM